MDDEGQQSLECIQANQIFPRKHPVLEEESLQVPFPELHGEFTEYVGRAEDAIIAMSNYRLHIKFKESVVNHYYQTCSCEVSVPLQLIECVECRDMFQLHVICKDCKVIRCQFSTFEQCQEWLKRLNGGIRPPSHLEELFSFAFHAWCVEVYAGEKEQHGELCRPGEHVSSRFKNEVERMGFDLQNAWRITEINNKYRLCASYPQLLLVPAWITDKELESVGGFRSWKRFPAVVYRHQSTGAVIARCGQPEVSWWGWRNADDEHLVQSIAKACAIDCSSSKHLSNGNCLQDYSNGTDISDGEFDASMTHSTGVESLAIQPQKLLILDARSYAAAVANRAKGGGCECPEYYPNCEVVFMGMANIHSIRKSFQSLRLLCTQMPDPANWLSALEGTKWLQHLSVLLKASLLVVNAVDRDLRPVLVHCSDGWDRTPQIVALSKLLLDPFYRTIEGFQVLVETEWLDFGHKFADRCGHGENSDDLNERCPVFLQWLDCVHQLHRQFPCSFEFNEAFLVKLVQHTYSCLFGTFLCNNGKEREDKHTQERSCSVWSLLRPANRAFRNMLYSSHSEMVLHPVCHVRNLMLWSAVYLPNPSPSTPTDQSCAPYPVPGSTSEDQPLGSRLPKTRSFDNLPSACEAGGSMAPNRRSSDPSLNEKWQDHCRSLELNIAVGPEGGGRQDQGEGPPAGGRDSNPREVGPRGGEQEEEEEEDEDGSLQGNTPSVWQKAKSEASGPATDSTLEAELLVEVGVAEGQMETILHEATKEESGAEDPKKEMKSDSTDKPQQEDLPALPPPPPLLPALPALEIKESARDHNSESPSSYVAQEPAGLSNSISRVPILLELSGHLFRTIANGYSQAVSQESNESESHNPTPQRSPPPCLAPERLEDIASLMESSTETLTEEGGRQEGVPTACLSSRLSNRADSPLLCPEGEGSREAQTEPDTPVTLNGGHRLSQSALLPNPAGEFQQEPICNGEVSEGELWAPQLPQINGHYPNGERVSLSRQMSAASCGSLALQARGSGSSFCQHQCPHSFMGRPSPSPEQPARSHLDDDGLAVYNDIIQQRLRQIEAGHQLEVETLKKQVQELWSRLESQHFNNSLRINGDTGDEVTSTPDSESNLDQSCLSRCSTELFSEASWEQVDKQDTEVTRWYPDHLAPQCYGCESRFWLASRKHHCRNCGNVFCSTCCDQKIPVPSQQLFEPSRVCMTCYGSLQPHTTTLELELEKPITASSN
ncbi:myotubularin-related protein 3-like isoform X3 [Polyodon spathula]|uniref:myotubularin-related protein 3-like isoform X3 n=1 Tax=Polyodon spathula TaxID=7913 RepID=UPI001B7DD42D|nr:myotubularin-related protein 3-like isoform X3 [Polyodon spathula]